MNELAYSTRADAARPIARWVPSFYTHFRVAMTIIEAAGRARRGKYTEQRWTEHSRRICTLMEHAGVKMSVWNTSAFDRFEGPCIVVANHMSTLETFALPAILYPHRHVTFVIKRSLVEYPVFKHVMLARDPIVVGRENPREDLAATLEGAKDRTERGLSLIVFPQTTRTPVFNPAEFNTIGVKMARRAGVPVVPLALKTDAWENGRHVKELGRIVPSRPVRFHFGEPLEVQGTGRETHERIVEFIQGRLSAWAAEDARET